MKVRQIIQSNFENQKAFFEKLRIKKKLTEYAAKNDISLLYSIVHSEASPVFVLSTGRCGTAFLTRMLQLAKTLEVHHEPEPEFFYHSAIAYKEHSQFPDKISGIFDVARYEPIRNSYVNEKKYVETNNRVTFFANQIVELYPKAKFIHLVRKPESFIKSGLSRDWYSGNSLYDEGRIIGPKDEWKHLSQIEKIGWLWNETNKFIEDFKSKNGNDKVLFLKAEDLFKSIEVQLSVFNFIGTKAPSEFVVKRVNSKVINEGKSLTLSESDKNSIQKVVSGLNLRNRYGY